MRMPKSISGIVWLAIFTGSLVLLSGLAVGSHKAAAACGGSFIGYFHGVDYSATAAVADNSVPQVDPGRFSSGMGTNKIGDVSAFVGAVEGSPAAQFYIGDMLGNACGGGSASDWAGRMQGLKVVYVPSFQFNVNSAHWSGAIVTSALPDDYFSYSDSSSAASLVVEDASGQVWAAIKIDCGNIVTSPRALPQDQPPTISGTITCNTIGTATLRATFSDPNGTPTATAKVGGWSQTIKSGTSYTIPYQYVENAGSGTMVVHNVGPLGASLDKTISASFPACNKPTTGAASATCTIGSNAAGDKYNFTVSFGDGNQATKAQLVGNGYTRAITSQGSFSVTTTTIPRSAFPLQYEIADMDDNVILKWDTKATINHTGSMNCPAKGTITPQSGTTCAVVNVTSWDANAPTTANQLKLILGTGGSQTYTDGAGQDGAAIQENVSSIGGFDPWRANTVTLQVNDVDSGTWTTVGTASLKICDSIQCSNTSPQQGWVAGETQAFQLYAKIVRPAEDKSGIKGPPGGHFYASISSPSVSGSAKSWGPLNYAPATGSLDLTNTPNNLTYLPPDSGKYTLSWHMADSETNPNPSPTCSEEVQVGYEPFFTVGGGDFAAGPGFGSDSCTMASASAGITAYNLNQDVAANAYFGSGSELGALANGTISGFATNDTNNPATNKALSSDGKPADLPVGLAFANPGTVVGDIFGGGYNHTSGWCVPSYADKASSSPTALPALNASALSNPGAIQSGTYKLTGTSNTLPGFTLGQDANGKGQRITLVVTGNIYLSGDITYDTSYSVADGDVTHVPQFNLLIKGGNLYVDHNVGTLDGFYDVQPNGNNGGTLYTCAQGINNDLYTARDYRDCTKQLTFYGAVSAAHLTLGRTHGNLLKTPTTNPEPAEQFIYSPELWLGNITGPNCKTEADSSACLYQSYTALPPIL